SAVFMILSLPFYFRSGTFSGCRPGFVDVVATPLLQLTSVTKSFGAVRALKGVSFDLRAGEIHALLGENGAGKSTLIKVITGAHQPEGGTIEINGERV